ncbi:MAG: hypothetical protein GC179_08720 [Anaerolineaceae bacterium]|nr:hypothetical protein [Anaerolineaceae bacterium]
MQIKYNPYALPLQDAKRQYNKVLQKPIWFPEDVKQLEQLNIKIGRLKLLVSIWEQSKHASN